MNEQIPWRHIVRCNQGFKSKWLLAGFCGVCPDTVRGLIPDCCTDVFFSFTVTLFYLDSTQYRGSTKRLTVDWNQMGFFLFYFFRFWLCQLSETQTCDRFSISKHTLFKHYPVSLTATTFGEEGVTIGRRLTFRLTEEGQKLWDAIEKETIFTEALAACCWSFWYFTNSYICSCDHFAPDFFIKYLPQDITSYLLLEHFLKPAKS